MNEAVIVAGARTPIGTSFRGSLADTDALDLATDTVKEAVRRPGIEPGLVDDVILGESLKRRDGSRFTFAADEHPRRTTSMEKLASLKPLHPEIEGFSITAGNAAGVNDGAAAVVVTSRRFAGQRGLEPLAVVRAWASAGVTVDLSGELITAIRQ